MRWKGGFDIVHPPSTASVPNVGYESSLRAEEDFSATNSFFPFLFALVILFS
jgi:hypothetical protein